MKRPKTLKLLSLLIATVLLCGTMVLPANAADVTVTVNSASASVGQTVTFTATLSESLTVKSGAVSLSYDKTALRLESGAWSVSGATLVNFDLSKEVGAFAYQNATAVSDTVFTATFTVLDTAFAGESTVGLLLQFKDAANTAIAVTNQSGTLTVTDGGGLVATVNDAAARPEETAVFTVTVSDAVSVKSGAVRLSYDTSALRLVSGVWNVSNTALSNFDATKGLGAFAYNGATEISGTVFTATFQVLSDAAVGTSEVGLTLQLKDVSNAAIAIQNKVGRMTVKPVMVISANIVWSPMTFTYTDGEWNPDKHDYETGVWVPDAEDGGQITVTNEGNVEITAFFSYTPASSDISGAFSKEEAVLAVGDTDTVSLTLSGRPTQTMADETLGNVTVTIKKTGED